MSEVRTNSITDAAGTGAPDFPNGVNAATALIAKVDDTERMRIDSSGNVGIGTTSPTADLSVGSTTTSSGDVHLRTTKTTVELTPSNSDAGGMDINVGFVAGGQGPLKFSLGSTERMRIDTSGNVGIGTSSPSPSALLTIGRYDTVSEGGEINLCRASDNASAWGIDVFGSTSTPSLRFVDTAAAVERMRIASAGQIGIGGANYGTSGQVLTSGGSGAAPSWASVGTAIAGLAYGAVGTYIYGSLLATNIADNGTYAGSSIVPAGILTPSTSQLTDASGVAAEMNGGGSALSGTWRAMGRSQRVNTTTRARISLFLRIS